MKNNRKDFSRGFTLTELLAVVIIIAILSGIASGSYKKSVEQSRFSDGLRMATTVAEAVDRHYFDTKVQRPKISQLDISFDNQQSCGDYCVKTKYFQTTITNNGYVEAARSSGQYKVRVYSNAFGSNTRQEPVCMALNEEGKNFCGAMGYTSCTGTGYPKTCSKP